MSQISLTATDLVVERSKALLENIFPSPRNFTIQFWNEDELPADSYSTFTLVLNHPGALHRMFTTPVELSLGEAYIYGDFDIKGNLYEVLEDIYALVKMNFASVDVLALVKEIQGLPKSGPAHTIIRRPAHLLGELHSRERDREAIRYHYDVGNEFYSLWLDRQMQYSCGYFPTGLEDINEAQARKIEHICRKLRLKPRERLLDIGCGWGGLAIASAQAYGVRVQGVTLSKPQFEYGVEQATRQGLSDRVRIEMRDYRDLENESFDKIVSVGMFEHVGRSHLPEYFSQAYRLLRPGGLFLNHGISRRGQPDDLALLKGFNNQGKILSAGQGYLEKKVLGLGSFSQSYIFPDGELVPVSEANLIAEAAGFEVRDVENLREHYALTLRNWVRRLEERQVEATRLVGEAVYRTWRLYMSFCALGFESGRTNVNQSLLAKPVSGKVDMPLNRADLYTSNS
ncbi:putative fatty acid methyltransferase [Anaerolineales bacterium]|nr:putative fatty acid methyltransferase [Anaerolineales bacterium]